MSELLTDKEAKDMAYRSIVDIDVEIKMRETLHDREIEKLKRRRAMFETIVDKL